MWSLPVRWFRVGTRTRDNASQALCVLMLLSLAACGGGGGYGGGDGGSAGNGCGGAYGMPCPSSSSSASSSSVSGTALAVNLTPTEIFPVPTSSATATASLTIDTAGGASSGDVTLNGVTATAVTINDAFAGNTGPVVLTLTQNSSNASVWSIPGGSTLNAGQLNDLAAGKLYVLVTSASNPNGELRGQIVPSGITVVFTTLGGDRESPAVTTSAAGTAAVTVNTAAKTAAVNVNTSGVNNATGVQLLASFVGSSTMLVALAADNAVAGHWLNENVTLTDNDLANFNSSRWYVNVFTPAHVGGEIRGQFAVNPPTLATLQANLFTPICSACHTGVGGSLPGSQNLTTAAQTYANVVDVTSLENGSLKRIRPYDPDNSYLVHKIEGDPSIVGGRMPLGGPYLSQTQIDQVRAWAAAGAQNN